MFAAFTLFYCALTVLLIRKERSSLHAVCLATGGAAILTIAWCLLTGFCTVVHWMANSQWPSAFWNTSGEFNPSFKTGVAMAISAKPLPLLCYLVPLWLILPGTGTALMTVIGPGSPKKEHVSLLISVTAGVAFVVFHLSMIFVGYFVE